MTDDKTIFSPDGRMLLISTDYFIENILSGDYCFICGNKKTPDQMNDEHILPNWILKEFNLYGQKITLANGSRLNYGQYKVPCCYGCNSLYGEELEEPISQLLKLSYVEFTKKLIENNSVINRLFIWLCFIFFKTHFKDLSFRFNLNKKEQSFQIADMYEWETIHHVYCMARSIYTKPLIDSKVWGTLFICPAKQYQNAVQFDFIDAYELKSIHLRLNEICIFAVLNDSCGSYNLCKDLLEKCTGMLSPLQSREMFSRISFANKYIKKRPEYFSSLDSNGNYLIDCLLPEKVEMEPFQLHEFGKIMEFSLKDVLNSLVGGNDPVLLDNIRNGETTFLLNSDGTFNSDSLILITNNKAK